MAATAAEAGLDRGRITSHLPSNTLDQPEVEDTASVGGWVWIVLFGGVMVLSLLANLLLTTCVLVNRKKHSVVYFLLLFLFTINLVDYSLLIFEFSMGMTHEYPYSEASCTLYQISARGTPILQAATVLVLVHYAAGLYCTSSGSPDRPTGETTRVTCSRTNNLVVFVTMISGLIVLEALFSIPTAIFAAIVSVDEKQYCEIDVTSVVGSGVDNQQKAISIFYLLYSAVFSYWLPLLFCIYPMLRLYRSANSDKYPEVSVVLSTASSFFVFFVLHAAVVFARHLMDATGFQLSTYQSWMIKVAQSLLWLVAYFWHFTRPSLAILLDPEMKQEVAQFFGAGSSDYSSIAMNGSPSGQTSSATPLSLVTRPVAMSTTTTTNATTGNDVFVADPEELTALSAKQDPEVC